jgi:thiol-disulfide isomerase/thioredoxin
MRLIYIFCLLIIIISLVVLTKKLCFSKQHINNENSNNENSNNENSNNEKTNNIKTNNNTTLIIYTTTWCGNCQKIKPIIKKLKKTIKNRLSVSVEEIDCDSDRDKCYIMKDGSKHMISSVPTIILRKESTDDIVYRGGNKENDIFNFVKSNN